MPEAPSETFEDPIRLPREPEIEEEPHLFVVIEGERPRAGGARYGLDQCGEVVLGRGTAREATRTVSGRTRRLTIALPDRRLSALHARLTWSGTQWVFEDAGSRNGSLVNGRPASRVVLADRDVIQVGHTILLLRTGLLTPTGTPDTLDAAELASAPIGTRTLSPMFARQLALLAKVASSRTTLLLLGETGTGKEVLARALHARARPAGPLVPVNCGAIPANLVESQLFGHLRGAFSGAVRDEPGFVRAADHGTLFLDEIGDLPLAAQPALLRVLQEGEVVPVGSTEARRVDLRVTSATHRPLEELVARGAFREDLLARLAGFTFLLPPLRERRGDIGLLLADLLPGCEPVASIDPDAACALVRHRWPQNVRELARVLSLAALMAEGGPLRLAHLPPALARPSEPEEREPREEAEATAPPPMRAELLAQLERQRGNVTEVARAMGTRRAQVYRWLKALRVDPKLYRE